MAGLTFEINGEHRGAEVDGGVILLDMLRDVLSLKGAKDACRRGDCGACTVLVGGRPVLSCMLPASLVTEPIETVEGLAEEAGSFRAAMADAGGFQCGFCTSGIVVRAVSLLRAGLPDDDAELARAMSGNLCRCTGYRPIFRALREAARP